MAASNEKKGPKSSNRRSCLSKNVAWALKYAKQGWLVFPVARNAKVPPKGVKWTQVATKNPAEVRELFAAHPEGNIGVVTGRKSGVLVVDVDPRNGGGESLARLVQAGLVPKTLAANTPSGGQHYFYASTRAIRCSTGAVAPGIDIKADGGYVVVSPSKVGGRSYEWVGRSDDLIRLPKKLRDLITSTNGLKDGACIEEGMRNNSLFAHAVSMFGSGATLERVRSEVFALNSERCRPPLPDHEVSSIVQSASSKGRPATSICLEDYAELKDRKLPDPKFIISELVLEGVSILAGAPKIGKSFLALQMALAVVRGSRLWDGRKKEKRGGVLFLGLEDSPIRIQKRTKALVGDISVEPGAFTIGYKWPRMDAGGVEELDVWLTAHPGTRLVVIDTLECIRAQMNTHRSVYAFDYSVGSLFKPLADKHHVGILLVHHSSKGDRKDFVESVNGTHGLAGGADTVMLLSGETNSDVAVLKVKGRDVGQATFRLRADSRRRWKEIEQVKPELSGVRRRIIEVLKELGSATPAEIVERSGIASNTVRQRVQKMRKAGQVRLLGKRYSLV